MSKLFPLYFVIGCVLVFASTKCVAQSKRDRIDQLLWRIDSLKMVQTEESEKHQKSVSELTIENTTKDRQLREAVSANETKKAKIKELDSELATQNAAYFDVGERVIDCKSESAGLKADISQLSNTPMHRLYKLLMDGQEVQFKLVENLLGAMTPGPTQGCMNFNKSRIQISYNELCDEFVPYTVHSTRMDQGVIYLDFTMHFFGDIPLNGYMKCIDGSYYLYYSRPGESVTQIERYILIEN
jgi:septal ring factor EnvC (AmiA/AmiB activator)